MNTTDIIILLIAFKTPFLCANRNSQAQAGEMALAVHAEGPGVQIPEPTSGCSQLPATSIP